MLRKGGWVGAMKGVEFFLSPGGGGLGAFSLDPVFAVVY